MNCAASKALLTLYVLKDLDEVTATTVQSHLDDCPACRAALQDIDSTLGLLRDALAAPTQAPAQLGSVRRTRILDKRSVKRPTIVSGVSWFTHHHRALAAAAAAVFVVGMISLILPATKSDREVSRCVVAEALEAPQELDEVQSFKDMQCELVLKHALPSAPERKQNFEEITFGHATMVKSPVSMRGLLGNRTAALQQYAGAAAEMPQDDSKGDVRAGSDRSGLSDVSDKSHKLPARSKLLAAEVHARRGPEKMLSKKEAVEAGDAPRWNFTAHGVNPFVATRSEPFSTFGIDVDTASYTLTRNMMTQGLLPPAEAVRTEEFVNAFDYDYVAPSHRTFRIYTELAPSPFGRGLHMLKIGVKGRRLGREEQRPAVLTFLVDTSGSMNAPERIGLVRKALRLLVENLGPNDQVAVIQYDSHARLLLEHTAASEKARILQAINRMQCSGSTNLEEGMNEAYRLAADAFMGGAENRVLLLSDGVANLGNVAVEDILKKIAAYRKQGIFCSVFGVGSGSYDDTMLETLANKGDGVYTFLDSEEEARRVFVDDLAATLNTIAADVKIQVEFNPNIIKQYRQLGYENRRLKKEDFRNDAVDAGEVGSGQSVTALYELDLRPHPLSKRRIALPPRKLATVRVRYRRIDTGRVEEIERSVWPHECVPTLNKASSSFRLATTVAEFAELLRGSPHAKGSTYEEVAAVLRPIALELHLDKRVQELLQMVMAAESTPRGQ